MFFFFWNLPSSYLFAVEDDLGQVQAQRAARQPGRRESGGDSPLAPHFTPAPDVGDGIDPAAVEQAVDI